MVYANPAGHNWGLKNTDIYALTTIAFAVIYSLLFYTACTYLYLHRNHQVVRMRKITLSIMAVVTLHVYLFMSFMVYYMNGAFPCGVEYWIMSIYLPLGIGIYQASNQDLLRVSRGQYHLLRTDEPYKKLPVGYGKVPSGPRFWHRKFALRLHQAIFEKKLDILIFAGLFIQFAVSLILYCMSRRFNSYGIFSHAATPHLCRRGPEWLPSIVWQFLWNWVFGPFQLWQMRGMRRDIYYWRVQTYVSIIASLPGTPLWLMGVYTDNLGSLNKYWVPPMWFIPGLMTIEIVTLAFPIYQIRKHVLTKRAFDRILRNFDNKQQDTKSVGSENTSITLPSSTSGKMYPMSSLEECLRGDAGELQAYASGKEFRGENIIFLTKVLQFKNQYPMIFERAHGDYTRARMINFKAALRIFVCYVHTYTAEFPINIESPIYKKLNSIFGQATTILATARRDDFSTSSISDVTPWAEPSEPATLSEPDSNLKSDFALSPLSVPRRYSNGGDSNDFIIAKELINNGDPLQDLIVPSTFNDSVFNEAFESIKFMVWSETWQRYMAVKHRTFSCSDD